jgi:hypothetical protein
MLMTGTLPPTDHWHVAYSRGGEYVCLPERQDAETAKRVVRALLVSDARATGDSRYREAIAAIDRGYGSYRIESWFYVAFPCACPQLPEEKGSNGTGVSQVLTL